MIKKENISWKEMYRNVKNILLDTDSSIETRALSVALGVFVGLTPLWGFHTIIVLFLAVVLKLNKPLCLLASQISALPFVPIVLSASMYAGGFFFHSHFDYTDISIDKVQNHLVQYCIGSFILAIIVAPCFGFLYYILLKYGKRKYWAQKK